MPLAEETKDLPSFDESLKTSGLYPLMANGLDVFQVNVGKKCNQACKHCHVAAGPHRTEMMSEDIMEKCIAAIADTEIKVVDITGGAPEMHPLYRHLVRKCGELRKTVMTRCNLTILMEEGQEDTIDFLKNQNVIVVASLPYFRENETDAVRGAGVFRKSIEAIRRLNDAGFGVKDSGLVLNLVYNPAGAFLPPPQQALEKDFKKELASRYGLEFNNLFAMTNMPIARFQDYLVRTSNYARYVAKLTQAYNPGAARGVMCKNMVSVGWDGTIYDCDFNQMLGILVNHGAPSHIDNWDPVKLAKRQIMTGLHCYGCTAGNGSSCGGATS